MELGVEPKNWLIEETSGRAEEAELARQSHSGVLVLAALANTDEGGQELLYLSCISKSQYEISLVRGMLSPPCWRGKNNQEGFSCQGYCTHVEVLQRLKGDTDPELWSERKASQSSDILIRSCV